MARVFLVHTPYHLLLASSIALSDQGRDDVLFVYRDFDFDSFYLKRSYRLFSEVIILGGNLDRNNSSLVSKILFQRVCARNIKLIRRLFERKDVTSVCVFNDQRVENQKAIQFCARSSTCEVSYAEDGSAVYSSASSSPTFFDSAKQGLKRIIYNLDDSIHSSMLGSNKSIDKRIVLFSELVRKELGNAPFEEIGTEDFVQAILFLFGQAIESVDPIEDSAVIFLDLFDFIYPQLHGYMNLLERIVAHYGALGKKVYMKYHPRESSLYADSLIKRWKTIHLINKEIPSEAVICRCRHDCAVIASISTSLLAASKISDRLLRISLMNLLDMEDKGLESAFSKLGVALPRKFEDLEDLITRQFSDS